MFSNISGKNWNWVTDFTDWMIISDKYFVCNGNEDPTLIVIIVIIGAQFLESLFLWVLIRSELRFNALLK